MSNTSCFYPIVGALLGALDFLNAKDWSEVNETQKEFLAQFYNGATNESRDLKELETRASTVAAELNSFLKERGFSITLDEFKDNEFGVVSILDVLVEWVEKAQRRKLQHEGKMYDAAYLDDNFSAFKVEGHEFPVARIDTKRSGEYVYLTRSSKALESLELMNAVKNLQSKLEPDDTNYDGLLFPMVELNQEVDISWLQNMFTMKGTQKWSVAKALQQTKFRMNEEGARAESAVALTMRCASVARPKPILKIDGPFFAWIVRDGLSMPLFAGYITPEEWKDPKTLASAHDTK